MLSTNQKRSLDFNFQFKKDISLERRKVEAEKIRAKFAERVPIIIEKVESEQGLPDLEQTKFLIPIDFTFHQFQSVIRKRLALPKTSTLFIFFEKDSKKKLTQGGKLMSSVYEECMDEDGFLYCKYAGENLLG